MLEEFYTELVIYSDNITPEQLNFIIGLKCDKGYHVGDLRGRSTIRSKENSWIIYSRISRSLPLDAHVIDLLERVSPIIEKIRNVADQQDTHVEFGCVVYTRERPAIFFTREQTLALNQMGASMDIDLYILPAEGDGN